MCTWCLLYFFYVQWIPWGINVASQKCHQNPESLGFWCTCLFFIQIVCMKHMTKEWKYMTAMSQQWCHNIWALTCSNITQSFKSQDSPGVGGEEGSLLDIKVVDQLSLVSFSAAHVNRYLVARVNHESFWNLFKLQKEHH